MEVRHEEAIYGLSKCGKKQCNHARNWHPLGGKCKFCGCKKFKEKIESAFEAEEKKKRISQEAK
jgi:hypothetical protein